MTTTRSTSTRRLANLVAPDRPRGGLDPHGRPRGARLVAQGASQSAARLASYLNGVQPLTRRFDAFLLLMYFGGGTPLDVGDGVMTVAGPARRRRSAPHPRRCAPAARRPRHPHHGGQHRVRGHVVLRGAPARLRPLPLLGGGRRLARVAARHGLVVAPDGAGLRVRHPARRRADAGHQPGLGMAPVVDAGTASTCRPGSSTGTPPPVQPRIAFAGEPPADRPRRPPHRPWRHPAAPGGGPARTQQRPAAVARRLLPAGRLPRDLPGREGALALRRPATTTSIATKRPCGPPRLPRSILPRDVDPLLAEAEQAFPL